MTNYYYYIENDVQLGPFSLQDLKNRKIQKNTLVWCENMENWDEAKNVEELNEILKFTPPPIPINSKIERPLKVEAEIIRKKEKLITPEREIIIAKEAKQNYKLVLVSVLIGIVSFIYFINEDNGFKNKSLAIRLENDMNDKVEYYDGTARENFIQNRENLKSESSSLGYYFDENNPDISRRTYFFTPYALDYHNVKFNEALKESIIPSLFSMLISSFVLIFGRYLLKSAKWVNEKAK